MDDKLLQILLLTIGGVLGALPGIATAIIQRRRENATAKKLDAEASKTGADKEIGLSAEARQWAKEFRDELNSLRDDLDKAQDTIAALTADNATLKATLGVVQEENKALKVTQERIQLENIKLHKDNTDLLNQVNGLERQLAELRNGGPHD